MRAPHTFTTKLRLALKALLGMHKYVFLSDGFRAKYPLCAKAFEDENDAVQRASSPCAGNKFIFIVSAVEKLLFHGIRTVGSIRKFFEAFCYCAKTSVRVDCI